MGRERNSAKGANADAEPTDQAPSSGRAKDAGDNRGTDANVRTGDLKTPAQWAKEKGTRKMLFAAAGAIYQWPAHAYHYGRLELSEADFDGAMDALSPPYHLPAMGLKGTK